MQPRASPTNRPTSSDNSTEPNIGNFPRTSIHRRESGNPHEVSDPGNSFRSGEAERTVDEAPRRVHARTSDRRPPTTAVDSGASRRWPIFLHRNSGLQGKEGCFIEEDEEKIGGRSRSRRRSGEKKFGKALAI